MWRLIKHRRARLISLVGTILLLLAWTTKSLIISREYQIFGQLVHRVNTQEKVVALTFDDGPSQLRTQQILALLKQQEIRATFFLNGKELNLNRHEAELLVASEHEIGNHSYSHDRMILMAPKTIEYEVESTESILQDFGYQSKQPNGRLLFRPPYGNKFFALPYYLQKQDIISITWDIEPETSDRAQEGSDFIVEDVINKVKPGSIILLHVMYGSTNSIDSVAPIVSQLKADGYEFLTVSELLKKQTLE
jgi:peptidoglycan/xylan/chitin deacetylase (PgdA/CDA1 family)